MNCTTKIVHTPQIREKILTEYYNIFIQYEYFYNDVFKIRKMSYLHSEMRKAELVLARSIIANDLRSKGYTLQDIAYVLKRSQHATVLNLLKRYTKKANDKQYTDLIFEIAKKIKYLFIMPPEISAPIRINLKSAIYNL